MKAITTPLREATTGANPFPISQEDSERHRGSKQKDEDIDEDIMPPERQALKRRIAPEVADGRVAESLKDLKEPFYAKCALESDNISCL